MIIKDVILAKTSMQISSILETVFVTLYLKNIYGRSIGDHTFYFKSSTEAFHLMRELEDALEDKTARRKGKNISFVLRDIVVKIQIEDNRLVAIGHGEKDDTWVGLTW